MSRWRLAAIMFMPTVSTRSIMNISAGFRRGPRSVPPLSICGVANTKISAVTKAKRMRKVLAKSS